MSELFKHAHLHAGRTENGAVNHTSSMSALVNFYKAAGSSRSNVEILPDLFYKALREDVDVAVRILLHMRDVREGMGERKAFRTVLLQAIEDKVLEPTQVLRIMDKIAELGRFDDFKIFVGTRFETDAFKHLEAALLDPATAGLAAKWLPRVKPRHKQFVKRFCKFANLSEKEYRTLLSALSDTVEQKSLLMSLVRLTTARFLHSLLHVTKSSLTAKMENVTKLTSNHSQRVSLRLTLVLFIHTM
ncbi:Phage conserved protein [Escherichia phage Barry]|uniref:Phage conserved protein n=1 Tax=Escherichia phage Barry TaxID=2747780 RepID=A0AAD1Q034_9CAUD|nr:Phage conserved protein [Escherichia phage Barry]